MKRFAVLPVLMAGLAFSSAEAQGRSSSQKRLPDIPVSARPPAGMCRIWLDDVPAAQQPAPTDCASAVKNRTAKGRVIFGDDYVAKGRKSDSGKSAPPVKGFSPKKRRP